MLDALDKYLALIQEVHLGKVDDAGFSGRQAKVLPPPD